MMRTTKLSTALSTADVDEPDQTRPSTMIRHRRVLAGLAVLAVLVALIITVVSTDRPPETPVAAADPTPPPPPPETAVATTESTTATAPPETAPEAAPPTTLPPPKPGPPVWPSTGAQSRPGQAVTIYNAMNGRSLRTLTDPWGPIPSHPAFRVIEDRGAWLKVSLPLRPNESTGWIKKDDVNLYTTNISVDIDLDARWITVYDKDKVAMSYAVVVGTASTPTPAGNFFVTDLIPNPGGAFGTFALGLSARSNVLNEFAGGDGQVAIHGTNQPQLMGTASSHGCVRVTNDVASRIGRAGMVGIPVRIHHG